MADSDLRKLAVMRADVRRELIAPPTTNVVAQPSAAQGRKLSRPRPDTPPKLIKLEQAHPLVCARRRPGLRRVVAPRRQVEPDVLEILVGGDVLERLEAVLDEPDAWA